MLGQLAEAVAFDQKRPIESRAHVLECNLGRQIDDLLRVEVALEFLEDLVGNIDGAKGHLLCIV